MKTLVLSMISIAATLAAMTACTSEGDPIDEGTKDTPVEIKLNAGINNITVKSTGIQTNDNHDFDANVIASSTEGVFTSSIWDGTDPGKITVKSGAVAFATTQAYPSDGGEVHMKAYAPFEGNFTSDKVTFTIDGNKDVMISQEIKGSKKDNTGKKLTFAHLLAQLNFTVAAQNEAAQKAWGEIKGIKVQAIANLDLVLSTGVLTATSEATEADIPTIGFNKISELPLTTGTPSDAGYVMVLPRTTAYKVIIESEHGPSDKTIILTTPQTTVASTAYNVLLTFTATDIDVTAEVGVWNTESGSGTVD